MYASYGEMFGAATRGSDGSAGYEPYPYQRALAKDGLPELLEVPTGMGKTLATVTAWLYRRRFHPDLTIRQATPPWLVFVLPMRVLVEQTREVVDNLVRNLGLADFPVYTVMGGERMTGERDFRNAAGRDCVIIATMDMVVSRRLNRGYGESRYIWPIDFGLLNNNCHFVYDELQLMGPALPTTRQLHGLADKLGTASPCASTWMSATVNADNLATVDSPQIRTRVALTDQDRAHPSVRRRVGAAKRVVEVETGDWKKYGSEVSAAIADAHRPGTLTLVIVNTIDRAAAIHDALLKDGTDVPIVLLHSRFRPGDRAKQVRLALADLDPSGPGQIVVSTQVVEAGVDISATTLFTEVAPWPSIVQRAGRCNRDGAAIDPVLHWIPLPAERSAPYEADDLEASAVRLRDLSGTTVDSQVLTASSVAVTDEIQPVLRRKDLLELFDTLPDVSGNDIDVSRYIRASDDLDVSVVWLDGVRKDAPPRSMPGRDERCPIPVGAFREWLKKRGHSGVWRWDVAARPSAMWVPCEVDNVRPGMVIVVDSERGGYLADRGWSPASTVAVEVVSGAEKGTDDLATADDPLSTGSCWVSLRDHLADTERQIILLTESVPMPGLSAEHVRSAVSAAKLHDIGKAHEIFDGAVRKLADKHEDVLPADVVFAKTAHPAARLTYGRVNFRHELASALALLGEGRSVLGDDVHRDLVIYLVAAHHGRVRVGLRSLTTDQDQSRLCALGVIDGDQLPAVRYPDGEVPASTLDLGVMMLGGRGSESWAQRALSLRDDPVLGPFRLGYLEALVRLADWRASANPTPFEGVTDA